MNNDSPAVYLGIDSATTYLTLALWSPEGGRLASFCEEVGRDHARRMIPELDALLQKSGVTRSQLQGIGVGVGPGSYTGLRVGIATARGLARGLDIPLSGQATLAAIAYAALEAGQQGLIALDARRDNVYAGLFQRNEQGVELLDAITKMNRAELREKYPTLPYVEGAAPDAGFLAKQAYHAPSGEVKALYL